MARPRAFQDSDVLTRAMLAFWQGGYEATGIKQLETATGLKASSLYNRFGSKEHLFDEVLTHYRQKVVQWRIQRYLQDLDPLQGIRRFFYSSFDYIDDSRPPMACLLSNSALELGHRYPELQQSIRAGMQDVEQALCTALENARTQGYLIKDTHLLAQQLALGLQGLLVSTRVITDKQQLQAACDALLALLPERKGTTIKARK